MLVEWDVIRIEIVYSIASPRVKLLITFTDECEVLCRMRIQLCGPVTIFGDGLPQIPSGRKQRGILALLAVNHGRVVSTDTLIDYCWENPPQSARANIRSYIASLRQSFESTTRGSSSFISYNNRCGGYRLNLEPDGLDVAEISRLLDAARNRLRSDPSDALVHGQKAKWLWQGDPGSDLPRTSWFDLHTMNLQELRRRNDQVLATLYLLVGQPYSALPLLRSLIAASPQNPQHVLLLAIAHFLNRETPESLRVIESARFSYAEFGFDLPAEICATRQAILNSDTVAVMDYLRGI